MGLARGIRKHGFRSWHERELLGSHGWLVLTLLCGFGALAALEALMQSAQASDQILNTLAILVSGAVGMLALRRFLYRLMRAQNAADQAVCARCEVFGRLAVVAEDRAHSWVRVRCRNCALEWCMDEP